MHPLSQKRTPTPKCTDRSRNPRSSQPNAYACTRLQWWRSSRSPSWPRDTPSRRVRRQERTPHPALPCRQPPQHPSVGAVAQQEDCPPAAPRPAVPGTAAVEAARQTGQRQAVPCSSLGVCGPQQLSGFLSAQPAAVPERSPCPSALRPLLTLKPADRRLHTQAPLSPSPSETASICAGWVSHAAAGSQHRHRSNAFPA